MIFRKFVLLISAWIFTRPVFAAPSAIAENHSTDLTSFNYYPHAGIIEITPHVTTLLREQEKNTNGTTTLVAENQFNGSLAYGFAPGWRVALSETLLWDQLTDATNAKGTETTSVSSGLSNPTFMAAWRCVEDQGTGISGDVSLNVSPSLGPKIKADGSVIMPGNNLSGGWIEEISTTFFWTHLNNQIELSVAVTNNSPITDRTSSGVARTNSYDNASLTLGDRYHLSARHFIQAGIELLPHATHNGQGSAGNRTATQSLTSVNDSLAFGYSPARNFVIEVVVNWHPSTSQTQNSTAETSTRTQTLTSTVDFLHAF